MSTAEKFELNDLIAVFTGNAVINSTEDRRRALVEYVAGKAAVKKSYADAVEKVRQYFIDKYPKIVQVSGHVANVILDQARYNKLVDLYGKKHEILPMKKTTAKKKELETA